MAEKVKDVRVQCAVMLTTLKARLYQRLTVHSSHIMSTGRNFRVSHKMTTRVVVKQFAAILVHNFCVA